MQGRNVNKEKQRRDGGALRGADIDGGQGAWRDLENQCAATITQKGSDSGDQVVGYPTFPEDEGQCCIVGLVKTRFDVQKEGGHLQARPLQGFNVVHKGEPGIESAQAREGAALVRVNQAP